MKTVMMTRKTIYVLLLLVTAIGVVLFLTVNLGGHPTKVVGNAAVGEKLFANNCASCHGEHGEGKKGLGRALNDSHYLQAVSNDKLWSAIAYGREKTAMGPSLKGQKGVKQLTEEQINDLVAYLRSYQKDRK